MGGSITIGGCLILSAVRPAKVIANKTLRNTRISRNIGDSLPSSNIAEGTRDNFDISNNAINIIKRSNICHKSITNEILDSATYSFEMYSATNAAITT